MVGISKLYCGTVEASDRLRYRAGAHRRPVVVWNCTPACNLSCSHCYAATAGEQKVMDTGQALAVIDDLAAREGARTARHLLHERHADR